MQVCEFCHTEFTPRPQVKRPRACSHLECQKKRQRANEREWKQRVDLYQDAEYHRQQRIQRQKVLRQATALLLRCLGAGREFLDVSLNLQKLSPLFEKFIFELGVRQLNKFCSLESVNDFNSLDLGLVP